VPRISRFYGIDVWMYRNEHGVPHFHASYAGNWVSISILTLDVLDGAMPNRALRYVREWAVLYGAELQENWDRARGDRSLNKILPLE
jgi:hypothetical protein